MRLRLGLLQDTASIDKRLAREAADAHARKQKLDSIPTVKTEAQTKKADEAAAAAATATATRAKPAPKPRIRPLSESKAIDSGATFVSEGFLFLVGISLIVFENWRSRRKETTRREDVADRISELEESERAARRALVELEREVLRLRARDGVANPTNAGNRILPRELWQSVDDGDDEEEEGGGAKAEDAAAETGGGWLSWLRRAPATTTTTKSASLNPEAEKAAAAAAVAGSPPPSTSRLAPGASPVGNHPSPSPSPSPSSPSNA